MSNEEYSKITGYEPQIGGSNNTGRPQLGEWIDATAYVKKISVNDLTVMEGLVGDRIRRSPYTSWGRIEEPVRGMYIGYRTVHEGRMLWNSLEGKIKFVPSRNIKVWLIVRNDRTNPIHVLPEDVLMKGILDG